MMTSDVAARTEQPLLLLWRTIVASVRGDSVDHTAGSLGRSILLLAIPMVMEMIMESVFAVADVFWVSRLGADAVAVVGTTETLMTLIYAVAMGLAMAAAATVARRIGEKQPDAAARTAVQAIAVTVGISAVLGIAGWLLAPHLLSLLGASGAVVAQGSTFARIMLGGNAVVFLLFVVNSIFRGAGDAASSMRVLWLANSLNILLGPCFIFGLGPFPAMGVTGAAVATTIGRGAGVVYQLVILARGKGRIVIRREHLGLDPAVMKSILGIAWTGMVQGLIGMTSWLGLVRIVNQFGSTAMAGYFIAIRIVIFALLPAWGLSNAAATLVGQNLGAKRPDRAEAAVWIAARYDLYFLGAVGLLFVIFAGPIAGLFADDPVVLAQATRCLRIVSLGFPLYAFAMVMTAAFNGAGDTWTPTIINLLCFWAWEVPFAWVLSVPGGIGPTGVHIAITVGFSTMALVALVLFRRGRWKVKHV